MLEAMFSTNKLDLEIDPLLNKDLGLFFLFYSFYLMSETGRIPMEYSQL